MRNHGNQKQSGCYLPGVCFNGVFPTSAGSLPEIQQNENGALQQKFLGEAKKHTRTNMAATLVKCLFLEEILEDSDEGETDDDDKTAANVVILSSLPFV